MKKFYAIVLGLALVLGMASIASADFSASGTLKILWDYDTAAGTATYGTSKTEMKLTLSKSWDEASAKLVLKAAPGTSVDSFEFAYKFSDAFKLVAANKFEVKSPLFETATNVGTALYGVYTFDGGKFQAGTNMILNALDLAAAAEFAFDPITVGAVFDYEDTGAYKVGPYVKYAVTDAITVTGDLLYEDTGNIDVAVQAAYEVDSFSADAMIKYDIDGAAGLYGYEFNASYQAADNLELGVEYASETASEYTVYGKLTINGGPTLKVSFDQDSVIAAELEAKF